MELTNKKILIVGGTSGFGKQVALDVQSLGAKVTVIGHDFDRTKKFTEETSIKGIALNAQDKSELENFFEDKKFDHIISTLGGAMGGGFLDSSMELLRRTIEDKFFANLQLAKIAVKHLNESGSLILTSGSGGHPYDASGAIIGNQAINTLIAGLGVELAPDKRANAVSPTWTPTGLWRDMSNEQIEQQKNDFSKGVPLKRVSTVKEVASAYIYLMQNDFVTGQVLRVDGGVDL
ncbi:SDR family oxidoreductase [Companilactobacillus keshanensis]|uniref:SDR family oxidoreductase n=1 Tax=Companilactobacillus keshanensis TaxID=2486003 RepID=A0ABW4BV83_9LACO|nr:SDR family oxidoreductase [Companilactobacillus keshanensis]